MFEEKLSEEGDGSVRPATAACEGDCDCTNGRPIDEPVSRGECESDIGGGSPMRLLLRPSFCRGENRHHSIACERSLCISGHARFGVSSLSFSRSSIFLFVPPTGGGVGMVL